MGKTYIGNGDEPEPAGKIKFEDIRSPLPFKNISGEVYREYVYESGARYRVEDPIGLHVSASGGHRIITSDGLSVYVMAGWIAFEMPTNPKRDFHWRF
jgi:hypothetical protein